MPPDGWTLQSAEPEYTWQITDDPNWVYSGDYAAHCPYANPPIDQDEWLITPELDLTFAEDINLVFWAYGLSYADQWTVELKVRIVGDSWVTLWDLVAEEEWWDEEFHNKTFNLNSYSGEIIQLAWVSVGPDSNDFYLDSIQVFAGEIPPPAELELEVQSFGLATITANVLNIATDERAIAQNVVWTFNLTGPGLLKHLEWQDNGTIPEIAADDFESFSVNGISGLSFNMDLNITVEDTMDPRVNSIQKDFRVIIFGILVLASEV